MRTNIWSMRFWLWPTQYPKLCFKTIIWTVHLKAGTRYSTEEIDARTHWCVKTIILTVDFKGPSIIWRRILMIGPCNGEFLMLKCEQWNPTCRTSGFWVLHDLAFYHISICGSWGTTLILDPFFPRAPPEMVITHWCITQFRGGKRTRVTLSLDSGALKGRLKGTFLRPFL